MSLANRVDALAVQLPDADPRKAQLRKHIASLADECGCRMAGSFFVAAAALVIGYLVTTGMQAGAAVVGMGLVVAASLVGKAIGLGVARLRLRLLERRLTGRLSSVEAR
jgi:hypothetical protein